MVVGTAMNRFQVKAKRLAKSRQSPLPTRRVKRGPAMRYLLMAVIVVTWLAWAPQAQAETVTFVSNPNWFALSTTNLLASGFAQNVCPNPSSPPNCPAGATLYGFPGIVWTADLSRIRGATWIWAPRITGATGNAGLAKFSFFNVIAPSTSGKRAIAGTIYVAADDFAAVLVNGTSIGTTGSVTNESAASAAQNALKTFPIPKSALDVSPSVVLIEIRARNGSFGGCNPVSNPTNCTYSTNPAGVVFGGSIEFQ